MPTIQMSYQSVVELFPRQVREALHNLRRGRSQFKRLAGDELSWAFMIVQAISPAQPVPGCIDTVPVASLPPCKERCSAYLLCRTPKKAAYYSQTNITYDELPVDIQEHVKTFVLFGGRASFIRTTPSPNRTDVVVWTGTMTYSQYEKLLCNLEEVSIGKNGWNLDVTDLFTSRVVGRIA